ncbi:MAG TPA: hypothetical protein VFF14_09050, partial [Candidatus Deferrimicrobium sp.]|nr:hypothetical protein [Candidatus Deferrimicrobium sp.]
HILSGWVSFVLGLGHAVYYLLSAFGRVKYTYTGIVATIIMAVLIQLGVMYQYKAIKLPVARKLHFALSLVLGVVMLTHI